MTEHADTSDRVRTDDTDGLIVADVMHDSYATLPVTATVADARAWFAAGARHRLALVTDGARYVGCLTALDIPDAVDADASVAAIARHGRTLAPDATAASGYDVVLKAGAGRVPVVDDDGHLVGVLAITTDARYFACRER